MMATLLSLFFATIVYIFSFEISSLSIQWISAVTGALFLLLLVSTYLSLIRPLQWAELKATPRVSELILGDSFLKWLSLGLLALPLSSLVLAAGALPHNWLDNNSLFCIWLIFAGSSIDLLRTYSTRLSDYFNPAWVIKSIVQRGRLDIAHGRDNELCDWIAALIEVALMAMKRFGFSLCDRAIGGITALLQRFLEVNRRSLQTEAADAKVHQRTVYVLFYSFERLQLVYTHALQENFEPICNSIITSLGKISLLAAHGDPAKVNHVLHFIISMADSALEKGVVNIYTKANLTLVEVGKSILTEIDLSKTDMQDSLYSLVGHLETIAKNFFRRDKEMSIAVLTQPLRDLKAMIKEHPLVERADMRKALTALDKVLEDFENLQLVLNTMPNVIEEGDGEKLSSQ